MEEFKLNEEQTNLVNKLVKDADELFKKYSTMSNTFEIAVKKIKNKMNTCDDEKIKEIEEEMDKLQSQTRSVERELEGLRKIKVFSDGQLSNGYKYENKTSFLVGIDSEIRSVVYELGKLEGYSLGEISTYSDKELLEKDCKALKKSVLELE